MKLNGGEIARNYLGKAQKHFSADIMSGQRQENHEFSNNNNNGNQRDGEAGSHEHKHEMLRSKVMQMLEAKDYESAHRELGMHMESMGQESEGEKDLMEEKGVSKQRM